MALADIVPSLSTAREGKMAEDKGKTPQRPPEPRPQPRPEPQTNEEIRKDWGSEDHRNNVRDTLPSPAPPADKQKD
jgi:hypothetical protein